MSRALAEALQVPHSVIKLNARVMEALEKQGCEGRLGERETCLKGIDKDSWEEHWRNVCACGHICPPGKRTKHGPNQFKGIKVVFTRTTVILILEGRNKLLKKQKTYNILIGE